MKTLKELEAFKKELDIPEANNELTGRLFALEEVVGLIDEIKEGEDLINGKILLISKEEIKKRINGK